MPPDDTNRADWNSDEEIFLSIARNCRHTPFQRLSFQRASPTLRNSKKFMLRALQIQPLLIEFAGPDLEDDFDICLLVFSDRASAGFEFRRRLRRLQQGNYVYDFKAEVKAKLALHNVFSSVVLPPISIASDCSLALLNQGAATSIAHKKLIAEFLGVPSGKKLRQLRLASRNLDDLDEEERKLKAWTLNIGKA